MAEPWSADVLVLTTHLNEFREVTKGPAPTLLVRFLFQTGKSALEVPLGFPRSQTLAIPTAQY